MWKLLKDIAPGLNEAKTDPAKEGQRRSALQVLAVISGIGTAFLAQPLLSPMISNMSNHAGAVFAIGLLASGGSGFWNAILSYFLQVKELKKQEVATAQLSNPHSTGQGFVELNIGAEQVHLTNATTWENGKMTWRPAKSIVRLRDQVNELAPNRSKASDGTIGDAAHAAKTSDHNPWVLDGNVGIVTAIDITNDIAGQCDAQKIANALVESRDQRIKYLIWNSQILSSTVSPWTWRSYSGKNPHNHHLHLSIKSEKSLYDSVENWALPSAL